MDKRLLDILCCPVTKVPVRPLARGELDALNKAITGGGVQWPLLPRWRRA
jgi:uncharacterized protein YbaR (Trm112 family)